MLEHRQELVSTDVLLPYNILWGDLRDKEMRL